MEKVFFFLFVLIIGQGQGQGLAQSYRSLSRVYQGATSGSGNTVTIRVTFTNVPTNPTSSFAALKYNKAAWFEFERDDNLLPVYTSDYPFFRSKTFTDGCGNLVSWRGSVAVNARSNFNNVSFWDRYTGKVNALQLAEMITEGKWGVLNHSYYHENDSTLSNVRFWAPHTSTYSQSAWNEVENQKYTYQKLLAQGVEYIMRGVVVPSNYTGFIRAADSLSYLGSTSTNKLDGYAGFPGACTYSASKPGVNFAQLETLPITGFSKFNHDGFVHYTRNFQDNWTAADINTLKLQFADMMANTGNTKHLGMRLGTHIGTYPAMSSFFNYADSLAADQVWFVGMTEEMEYREVKRLARKTESLNNRVLTITIDLSALPATNRFRDMSLLIRGGTMAKVSVSGPQDRYTYNFQTGLINIFWEKTKGFPAPQ